jgi:hypothetical protein
MKQIDRELSRRIAASLATPSHSAWLKAWQVLKSDSILGNGLYVEGWAVTSDDLLAIEHGWLEVDDRIVDPSCWDRDLAYFPGMQFDKGQVLQALAAHPKLPITGHGGARLWDNPAYYRAWQDANAFVRSRLAERRGPFGIATARLYDYTARF